MTGLATAGLLLAPWTLSAAPRKNRFKAIAFDAFPIFDPRPIFRTVQELFPEKGKQIVDTWQVKQFGYQWMRAAGHRYKSFPDVTLDALRFALAQSGTVADGATTDRIMAGYDNLNIWEDVAPALEQLKERGLKLTFLSNMTEAMLQRGLRNGRIEKFFDHVFSTDRRQTYKPAPEAYRMAVDGLKLKKEEILFVPFAGWDLAGAKWFGYPAFWVNRLSAAPDELDAMPDGSGRSLADLVAFIGSHSDN